MTSILQWAKSVFIYWFAPPVALTPEHGLVPVPADARVERVPDDTRRRLDVRGL